MMQRLLLLMTMTVVLTSASPAFATNWGNIDWGNIDWGNNDWINDWWPSDETEEEECDLGDWFEDWGDKLWACNGDLEVLGDSNWWCDKRDWPSQEEVDEWWDKHEWITDHWGRGEWHCKPHEDPIPEPATAGLAFMGMGALIVATRRRRK